MNDILRTAKEYREKATREAKAHSATILISLRIMVLA